MNNDKERTAMMLLRDDLIRFKESDFMSLDTKMGLDIAIEQIERHRMETERKNIIEAHFEGGKDVSTRDYEDAVFYFTNKYQTP